MPEIPDPAWLFALLTFAGLALAVGRAFYTRGLPFGLFATFTLGVHACSSVIVFSALGWLRPLAVALQIVTIVHFLLLSKPRMRSVPYRGLVSVPANAFVAASFLGIPWALALVFGFDPWFAWLPLLVALLSAAKSLSARVEDIDLVLDGRPVSDLARIAVGVQRLPSSLAIVQISDPHLGPFMSAERLHAICERAVERRPDLVLLTGDYLTMESNSTPGTLARALEPLGALEGTVFASMGNHDHEAPDEVRAGLEANGIRLLRDESVIVDTEAGWVQIVGVDHVWRGREQHLREVCAANPRVPGALRILLLHDPSAFPLLPEGEGDLVLSGHTHGGQLGLLDLGLDWTILSGLRAVPDHGFWGLGTNRLYVHRGNGHYGFPLRVGVPAEESVLRIHKLPT
ncbi:MAG TPA: metallophosphoesterase [Myxococcota bacterium]|nr:metallophosphoesterase [Myxococcota bacterium]